MTGEALDAATLTRWVQLEVQGYRVVSTVGEPGHQVILFERPAAMATGSNDAYRLPAALEQDAVAAADTRTVSYAPNQPNLLRMK